MFKDEEFASACRELDSPDLVGWEPFTQADSGDIEIYRKYNEKSGLYSYKIFGTMNVPPEICSQVYLDLEYRKVWDPYVKEIREVSNADKTGIYWLLNYPFPLSKRDFVYAREMRELDNEGHHIWVILSRTEDDLNYLEPMDKGYVRIHECFQTMAITSHGENGSKAFSLYYDDPGGLIPSWVINWAAKTGLPAFLANMQKACREYPQYLKNKSSQRQAPEKSAGGEKKKLHLFSR